MNLQTKISLKPEQHKIDYQSKIVLLGSCFTENLGNKLKYFKFQQLLNPMGILFNPVVIERLLCNALAHKVYSEADIFFYNERWHCYDTHSQLSDTSKEQMLKNLKAAITSTYQYITEASHIIITLGTAWVYKHKKLDTIVANCHKIPQKSFDKELLSIQAINKSLETMVSNIQKVNNNASIIFTVSPVRHLKDGFIENQQSKAHLIAGVHEFLNQKHPSINCNGYYFPSYEIMMDELRDYRFYNDDMLHPNTTAINYIWNKFKDVWLSEKALQTMYKIDLVQKGLLHKPFNNTSKEHQTFLEDLNIKMKSLTEAYPFIKF